MLARKDLALEVRAFEQLGLIVLSTFLILLLFRAASDITPVPVGTALWVTLVFAVMSGLARSFHGEADHGTLELLSASPTSPASLYLGKALSSFAVAAFSAFAALLMAGLFFGGGFFHDVIAIATFLLLGCAGLAAITTFASALSASARSRGALLPILVMPLALPLLLWAARGTVASTAGASWGDPDIWLNLAYLAAYDALFIGLFAFLAPRALAP